MEAKQRPDIFSAEKCQPCDGISEVGKRIEEVENFCHLRSVVTEMGGNEKDVVTNSWKGKFSAYKLRISERTKGCAV